MNTKNTKAIKLKLEATLPLSEAKPESSNCSNCSACGKCGQNSKPDGAPLLQHAGKILINMLGGQYSPEQFEDGFKWLDSLLRQHYSKKQ